MQRKVGLRIGLGVMGLIIAPLAQAHPGTAQALGLIPGMLHPFTGADHLLAAVAAGLWGAVLGGAHSRSVSIAFLGMLSLGAIAGLAGSSMALVEPIIALSVITFGVLIALRVPLPALVASAVAGGFAFFHGHAHAAGLPATAGSAWYLVGLLLATAFLLGCGTVLGRRLAVAESRLPLRLAGGFFALIGSLLLAYG
jgi:urease accessory protein